MDVRLVGPSRLKGGDIVQNLLRERLEVDAVTKQLIQMLYAAGGPYRCDDLGLAVREVEAEFRPRLNARSFEDGRDLDRTLLQVGAPGRGWNITQGVNGRTRHGLASR